MSYAEAATAGANLSKNEVNDNTVPVRNINVSKEESSEAQEQVDEERLFSTKVKRCWDKLWGTTNEYADEAADEIHDHPQTTAHVALTVAVAAGIASGLAYQKKIDKLNWWPVGACYAAGAVLFGGYEVYNFNQLKKQQKK